MITTSVQASSFLNLDYVSACRLLLPTYRKATLALVGCGGTGSWLAAGVVRVARLLAETAGKDVAVHFVDPDLVEERNVYRQNFCQAEIGRNKAATLAQRLGMAWGVEVTAWAAPLREVGRGLAAYGDLVVWIGCVDRASARREIHTLAQHGDWWLDCGNHQSAGQVVLGRGGMQGDPFKLPGFCSWLPLPTVWHPELVADEQANGEAGANAAVPGASLAPQQMSCAEMAMKDSQGLAINQRIAAEAMDYLVRMLLTKDLSRFATYMDLASGSARSRYITQENIKPLRF